MQLRPHQIAVHISVLCALRVSAMVHYVDLNSTNPIPPYTNWSTASKVIQDAVGSAVDGELVLVTDGIYSTGAYQGVYRVMLSNAVTLASVNGPKVTTILATNGVDAVYLRSSGAVLSGFTVTGGTYGGVGCAPGAVVTNCIITGNTNYVAYGGTFYNCLIFQNYSPGDGGGARYATLYDCVLRNNTAARNGGGAYACTLYRCRLEANRASAGGGAYGGIVVDSILAGNQASTSAGGFYGGAPSGIISNCTVTGNLAASFGGGMAYGTAYNCLITSNSAASGAGVYVHGNHLYNCTICANTATNSGGGVGMYYSGGDATLQNCIIYYNSANSNSNWESYSGGYYDNTYVNCCTEPLPARSYGCITNAPNFIGWPSGNFRLQSNSPCINVEWDWGTLMAKDLDGRPRISGGTVDIGAYEFQGFGMGEFIGWLQRYGLATDGSMDFTDPDHDGMSSWQEWVCDTAPTNAYSVLRMMVPSNSLSGLTITWQSVPGKAYYLERSSNLSAQPAFSLIESNIFGQGYTTSFIDSSGPLLGPVIYRVGIHR
jgi:hypothetical protein